MMSSMQPGGRGRPGDGRSWDGSSGAGVPPRRGIPDGAIVGVLATLLGTTTLVWLSTALGALVTHGHLPHPLPFAGTPTAIRNLATQPNSMGAAWPGTPVPQLPSPTAFWSTFFVLLALLIALALTILTAWMRLRSARQAHRAQDPYRQQEPYRPEESYPTAGPARTGAATAASAAMPTPAPVPEPRTAPPLAGPVTGSAPVSIHKAAGGPPPAAAPAPVPLPASRAFAFPAGMTALLVPDVGAAPYRRRLLQRAVETASGAVLVVTDDLALWEARPAHRDARLYDPLRLVDALDDPDARVRWAPHDHCDDPSVASARARALLAPTARGDGSTSSSSASHERGIQETAQTVLRCWLHAAALDGRPFRHIQRWASGTNRQEALGILRNADPHTAADGWDGELQTVLTHSTELRDSALQRIGGALESLSELQVQQACAPSASSSATDSLDVESVLRHRGTLYVLGRATETRVGSNGSAQRSVMPLLSALVEDVVERGRRMAVRSSSGRLDPPLLCLLDNAAAVAPFPGLPELMARGGPLGLAGVAVFRSPEQARLRWDERSVHSLWTSADARAVLGPLPAPGIDGLLTALGSGPAETESATAPGALDKGELLLLADRKAAQRFRIEGSSTEGAPVRS